MMFHALQASHVTPPCHRMKRVKMRAKHSKELPNVESACQVRTSSKSACQVHGNSKIMHQVHGNLKVENVIFDVM